MFSVLQSNSSILPVSFTQTSKTHSGSHWSSVMNVVPRSHCVLLFSVADLEDVWVYSDTAQWWNRPSPPGHGRSCRDPHTPASPLITWLFRHYVASSRRVARSCVNSLTRRADRRDLWPVSRAVRDISVITGGVGPPSDPKWPLIKFGLLYSRHYRAACPLRYLTLRRSRTPRFACSGKRFVRSVR